MFDRDNNPQYGSNFADQAFTTMQSNTPPPANALGLGSSDNPNEPISRLNPVSQLGLSRTTQYTPGQIGASDSHTTGNNQRFMPVMSNPIGKNPLALNFLNNTAGAVNISEFASQTPATYDQSMAPYDENSQI